jgi:hypothetical protein
MRPTATPDTSATQPRGLRQSQPDQSQPDQPWPMRTGELAEAERLVLSVFRHWLAGLAEHSGEPLSMAWNELARALGAAPARQAMSGLIGMIREMRHLRRPLRHHPACCVCVTGDEIAVLCLLAACQNGETERAQRQAEWLVRDEGAAGLLEHGARLAEVLSSRGYTLTAPAQISPARSGMAAGDTGTLVACQH